MFVIPVEALSRAPVVEKYPQLLVTDYPTTTMRLRCLKAYLRGWGLPEYPFLDQRLVPLVSSQYRVPFVAVTNTQYRRWAYSYEQNSKHNLGRFAGGLDACYICRKQSNCRECCLVALDRIPSARLDDVMVNTIYWARTMMGQFSGNGSIRYRQLIPLSLSPLYAEVPYRSPSRSKAYGFEGDIDAQKYKWES